MILVALWVISMMLSIVFGLAWVSLGRPRHALTWAVTFVFATGQWSCNLFRDAFPSQAAFWFTASVLAFATVTLALLGHMQRTGRVAKLPLIVGPIAASGLMLVASYPQVHLGLNLAVAPLYGGSLLIYIAVLILRYRAKPLPAEWAAAVATLVFAATQLVAAAAALAMGPSFDEKYGAIYTHVNFLALPAAYVGMGLFVVLMLAGDMAQKLREQALRDQLTGLLNRRGFRESAERALAQGRRSGRSAAAMLVDLDHFKRINDEHGHEVGDAALRKFGQALSARVRQSDVVGRWGGEEFVVLLTGADAAQALSVAESCRRALALLSVDGRRGPIPVTASYGVAADDCETADLDALIRRADAAMYRSKRAGRDRVELEARRTSTLVPV